MVDGSTLAISAPLSLSLSVCAAHAHTNFPTLMPFKARFKTLKPGSRTPPSRWRSFQLTHALCCISFFLHIKDSATQSCKKKISHPKRSSTHRQNPRPKHQDPVSRVTIRGAIVPSMVSDPTHGSVCKRKKPTHQKKREKPTTDLQTNHDKIMECEETMRPNSRCAQRRVENNRGPPKKKAPDGSRHQTRRKSVV